jgi:F-type H+-transporting ATPase subunit epsilon
MLHVKVFSLKKIIFDDQAHMVILPGVEGDLSLLENHIPFVTMLRPEHITICQNDEKKIINIPYGGFVHMEKDLCSIFVEKVDEEIL